MPDNKVLCDRLIPLIHLDIDAWNAYEMAIKNCDVDEVIQNLRSFQSDHDRHVRDLTAVVRRLGGEPPERAPDFKGFFIGGFTAIRSLTGTAGALKAMDTNEMLTTSRYKAALEADGLPADIRDLLQRNYSDEQRHLSWIRQAIERRLWERPSASP